MRPRQNSSAVIRPAPRRAAPGLARVRAWSVAIALILAGVVALLAAQPARAASPLRIAASRAPVSLPLYVAQVRGFFADEGLAVSIDDCLGGTRCMRRLLDGQDDVATTSEMPVVLHAFARPDVAIIATMARADDNLKLIARRASGVVRGEQLAGRRVGVIAGTAAQYLLETHLLAVGVDPRKVTMVPLQAEDTVAALRAGRIDAVAVWEPYAYAALHAASGDPVGVRLPLGGGYIESYNLVVGVRTSPARDVLLARMLHAVDRAEAFIRAQPADARAILRERLQLDSAAVDWAWPGMAWRLSLEQSLLSTMESEGRWARREGHVPDGALPDMLSLVYPGPLKAVRPDVVGTGN